eukprot:TRINITY_DN42430_c0_g1_i2.p1 TRINITY_DN42430_c0_g1~~TRINITY_DN42430_c0_g1_i2.p1  ORF type:complete len:423 (-),score=52.75 TRINITY_DN42430_c0_g1_i2:284-1552(-)
MAVEGKRVRDDVVLPPIVTPSTDGFCDEKSLPTDGSCQQHSIVELLRLSCLRCFDSACASRGDLVGAALKVWRSRLISPAASPPEAQKAGHHCLPAVRAAAIVLLHLQPGFRARMKGSSADLLAAEELSEADNDMLAVRPFPFAHQFSELYQRFRPANLEGDCMDDKYAKLGDAVGPADLAQRRHERTSLVPLVDAAVSRCSAASEDNHLVQRCLSRRHRSYIVGGGRSDVRRPEVGWPLPSWRCPRNETPLVGQKYDTQSWRSCSSARGSAGQNVAATLRCAAVAAGEALRVMPGSTVLEWGSGCGWMLTWLSTLFGARGYGIDASEPAIEWSRRFSPGSFCLWGDADLRWIADSSFDHVVSAATVSTLRSLPSSGPGGFHQGLFAFGATRTYGGLPTRRLITWSPTGLSTTSPRCPGSVP